MSATEFSLKQRPAKPADVTPAPVTAPPKSTGYTITYEESLREVPWQTDNRFIRKGYRRRLRDAKSVLFSLVGCEYMFAKLGVGKLLIPYHFARLAQRNW